MPTSNYKVALLSICLNEPYWIYQKQMIDSAKKFFLKGHDVDFLVWTDMPKEKTDNDWIIFPTEPHTWPIPTLMRYHLFLRQEEKLKDYDFLIYADSDMKFVSRVGDEILGDLVAAQHPMYAIKRQYIPPYEPNKNSTAYIPRPSRVIEMGGQKRLEPLYFAGGIQGGRSDVFIRAMKVMKENIDKDFNENNYVAVWNDESHWNKYCLDNPPDVVLSPSYVYPDSLIRDYYMKVWGRNYVPRLITITKPFSLTKQGGQAVNQTLQNI